MTAAQVPVLHAGAVSVSVWLPAGTRWRHALNYSSAELVGAGASVDVYAPIGTPCALWRVA